MEPVNAADCRLLLSLLKFAIVPTDQRERIEAWLEAKRDGIALLVRVQSNESIWPDDRTRAAMSDTIIPAR